jgi:hypothetical protein
MPKAEAKDDAMAVQYAALVSDLMAKTKQTLTKLNPSSEKQQTETYTGPVTLRMRTKENTELIVTDFVLNQYEYILVTIQKCDFEKA